MITRLVKVFESLFTPRDGEGVPQGTYPSPGPNGRGRGYPKVCTPCQVPTGGWGAPRYLTRSQGTYPPPHTPRYLPPSPHQGTYPQDRTTYGVLDMLRLAYLLRSRRRTFLFDAQCFLNCGRNVTSGSLRSWVELH